MKKITFLVAILVVIDIILFILKHDVAFSAIFFLAGLLAIFFIYIKATITEFLLMRKLEHKIGEYDNIGVNDTLNGYKLNNISEMSNFKLFNNYFECEMREHDSTEYIGDTKKSLFFASVIYIFMSLAYVISFFEEHSKDETKDIASKLHYAYIYLVVIAGYALWYLSPIMLFKKKIEMAIKFHNKAPHHTETSDKK